MTDVQMAAEPKAANENLAPLPRAMFTVVEFCHAHAISRSKLYALVAEGRGPTLSKVGRRTLISAAAAEAWRREIEQPRRAA
jgi:hypothetical protein